MGNILFVFMRSRGIQPGQRVTVSVDRDWAAEREVRYDPTMDQWVFEIDRDEFPDGLEFKFRCDGRFQLPDGRDGNLHIPRYRYDDSRPPTYLVEFPQLRPVIEDSGPARHYFPRATAENTEWDFIVIGSGFGGGVVAHQLASTLDPRGIRPKVLVLEAGSYLFPVHVGNLPRRHSQQLWDLWYTFRVENRNVITRDCDSNDVDFAAGINLGGKSLFWGAVAPRMREPALANWPRLVRKELEDTWYRYAEDLLNVQNAPSSNGGSMGSHPAAEKAAADQQHCATPVRDLLNELFPEQESRFAPVAVEYVPTIATELPGDIFTTAALLCEDREQERGAAGNLWVHLNEPVRDLRVDDGRIGSVDSSSRLDGYRRTYRLSERGRVVLAAGTVESAALALRSGLGAKNDLVGVGLTDHPILYVKFRIPPDATGDGAESARRLDRPTEKPRFSKTVTYFHGEAPGSHSYNMTLEIGTNLNQSQFISSAAFALFEREELDAKGTMCSAVFMFDADLVAENRVEINDRGETQLQVGPAMDTAALLQEILPIAQKVVGGFAGIPMDDDGEDIGWDDPDVLKVARLGAVGHEVGTMRMGEDPDGGNPQPSVVDTDLRVRGVENLYVCDLSVFPTSPASNPSLSLAALAMRLADTLTRPADGARN